MLEEILSWATPASFAGSWAGPATMRQHTTRMTLQLKQDEEGWSGEFEAPGWFPLMAISGAEVLDGEIRFDLELETTTLHVRARAGGSRLIGMLDYQGQWYPFVASRAPAAP